MTKKNEHIPCGGKDCEMTGTAAVVRKHRKEEEHHEKRALGQQASDQPTRERRKAARNRAYYRAKTKPAKAKTRAMTIMEAAREPPETFGQIPWLPKLQVRVNNYFAARLRLNAGHTLHPAKIPAPLASSGSSQMLNSAPEWGAAVSLTHGEEVIRIS